MIVTCLIPCGVVVEHQNSVGHLLGGGFIFLIFTPTWGRFPF